MTKKKMIDVLLEHGNTKRKRHQHTNAESASLVVEVLMVFQPWVGDFIRLIVLICQHRLEALNAS
jgi:hypothetical protein